MWKNVKSGRPQKTIWYMHVARLIPEATNTVSDYVTIITFLLQQWLHERTLLLRHTYIECVVRIFHPKCTLIYSPLYV